MLVYKQILAFVCLIVHSAGYKICPNIELEGYQYQLNKFGDDSKLALFENSLIEISLCKVEDCIEKQSTDEKTNYTTFIGKRSKEQCQPYTSHQPPLKQYYTLSNKQNPEYGIQVQFPPVLNNGYLYSSILTILCPLHSNQSDPNQQSKNKCEEISTYNNEARQYQLHCTIYSNAGCPQIAHNNFWKFLFASSIIFAVFLWIIALFLMFLGYLAIRATIWIFGIFSGTVFSLILSAENYTNFITESDAIFIYVICLSFFLGIVFGLALLTLPKLGYANIGVWVAAIFSLLLQNSVYYLTGSNLALYITFGVVSLIMIIISLLEFKYYIILCSSFVGGFWAIRPLGFFLPYYPNQLAAAYNFSIQIQTPWQFYLYLISIIILTVLGSAFQICLYKKTHGRYHGHNEAYYLQRQGQIKEKVKKLFQFREIKKLARSGRNQILQLKNLILDEDSERQKKSQMKAYESQQSDIVEMKDFNTKNKKKSLQRISDSDSESEQSVDRGVYGKRNNKKK